MTFGLITLTKVHVVISLIAIVSGLFVAFGLLTAKRFNGLTAFFLVTTVATSVTGFFFPFHGFTPAIGVGIVSLVVLASAIFARYGRKLTELDLRSYGHDCPLSKCFRFDCAAFPERSGAAGVGAHAV